MRKLIAQLWERIVEGPRCPDCPEHFARPHGPDGCLCHVYTPAGDPNGMCGCKLPYGGRKPTRRELDDARALAEAVK